MSYQRKGDPRKIKGRLFAALRVTDFWDSPFASKEMGDTPPFFLYFREFDSCPTLFKIGGENV
jgi:hypothetical protein